MDVNTDLRRKMNFERKKRGRFAPLAGNSACEVKDMLEEGENESLVK